MDLTAITTPFGLLDAETQEALKAHGGPYEYFAGTSWADEPNPKWKLFVHWTYRVKPAPPKPREWWIVQDFTRGHCIADRKPEGSSEYIHVREVIE